MKLAVASGQAFYFKNRATLLILKILYSNIALIFCTDNFKPEIRFDIGTLISWSINQRG